MTYTSRFVFVLCIFAVAVHGMRVDDEEIEGSAPLRSAPSSGQMNTDFMLEEDSDQEMATDEEEATDGQEEEATDAQEATEEQQGTDEQEDTDQQEATEEQQGTDEQEDTDDNQPAMTPEMLEAGRKLQEADKMSNAANAAAKRMAHRAMDQKLHLADAESKRVAADEALDKASRSYAKLKAESEVKATRANMLQYEWKNIHEKLGKVTDEKKAAEKQYRETHVEANRAETIKDKFVARAHMSKEVADNWTHKELVAQQEVDKDQKAEDADYQLAMSMRAASQAAKNKLDNSVKEANRCSEAVQAAEAEALKATEWHQRLADRAVVEEQLYAKSKELAGHAAKMASLAAKKEAVAAAYEDADEAAKASVRAGKFAEKASMQFNLSMKSVQDASK